MGLRRYIVKKVIFSAVAYFAAISVVFFIYHVMPGDPTRIFTSHPSVSPSLRDDLIARWGLNESLGKQYVLFLRNFFKGDLGYSFLHMRPVGEVIGERLPWSLLLLGASFTINGFVGIFIGALVAWRRGSGIDTTFVLSYNIYNAIPLFFVGMIMIAIFGYRARIWGWPIYFPFIGAKTPGIESQGAFMVIIDVLWHLFLPLLVLVIYGILGWAWFMRGNLINVKTDDYIQTARAKGLTENQVLFRHGFRNALLPVVTSIGMSIGGLIGGAVLVETVFTYPGTGRLLFDAIMYKDYPLLQGSFVIIAGITLLGLLIAEIMYGFIDPRIREAA